MDNYEQRMESLVQLERQAEMERHVNEIESISGYERQKRGRALLNMRGRRIKKGLGNREIVKYMKQNRGKPLGDHEISQGDLIVLSKNNPLEDHNPTGTVIESTRYSITVAFNQKIPGWAYKKNLRVDLFVNDITFQRMLAAINSIAQGTVENKNIIDIIKGQKKFESKKKQETIDSQVLNDSQLEAAQYAVANKDFELIQGPPGTGKTVTAVEILKDVSQRYDHVLATADSNAAVDNLLDRLIDRGVHAVRIGNPFRVNKKMIHHTLDYLVEHDDDYEIIEKLRAQADELLAKQDKHTHPSGRWRRGMSDQQIMSLANKNRSSRGVPKKKIKSMAQWLTLQDKIDNIFSELNQKENQIINKILNQADVICSTNATVGSELLKQWSFDYLLMDEATQATEPSALISIVKAKRVILIGDHRQLPPTVISQEAKKKGLETSLFERLTTTVDDINVLKEQYRMHEEIKAFSNQMFYEGQIESNDQNKNWKLQYHNFNQMHHQLKTVLDPEKPFVFYDIKNRNNERQKNDSKSYYNPVEAKYISTLIQQLKKMSIDDQQIGIITPYRAQVKHLRKKIGHQNNIEIDTVDSFQGREKDLIIFSLVRSNPDNRIGFLKDMRRLNVSLTRAKKKLIVIGDRKTIEKHDLYKTMVTTYQIS